MRCQWHRMHVFFASENRSYLCEFGAQGPRGYVWWKKNRRSKISWHCLFKWAVQYCSAKLKVGNAIRVWGILVLPAYAKRFIFSSFFLRFQGRGSVFRIFLQPDIVMVFIQSTLCKTNHEKCKKEQKHIHRNMIPDLLGLKNLWILWNSHVTVRLVMRPLQRSYMEYRFCYVVFNSHMFNATEVQLWKWCYFKWGQYTWGVRCAHFSSVITTIMNHKLQLLKPLNKREWYAT
jgi:hypothetical protein